MNTEVGLYNVAFTFTFAVAVVMVALCAFFPEIRTLRTWCLTQCVIPGHNGATVFCSAYRGGTRILKQFDLETGEEVQSVANLPHEMTGLAALDLGGTSCVAERFD